MGKASRKRSAKPVKPAATLEGDGTTPELEEEVDEDVAEVETEKIVINLGDMEVSHIQPKKQLVCPSVILCCARRLENGREQRWTPR